MHAIRIRDKLLYGAMGEADQVLRGIVDSRNKCV